MSKNDKKKNKNTKKTLKIKKNNQNLINFKKNYIKD